MPSVRLVRVHSRGSSEVGFPYFIYASCRLLIPHQNDLFHAHIISFPPDCISPVIQRPSRAMVLLSYHHRCGDHCDSGPLDDDSVRVPSLRGLARCSLLMPCVGLFPCVVACVSAICASVVCASYASCRAWPEPFPHQSHTPIPCDPLPISFDVPPRTVQPRSFLIF